MEQVRLQDPRVALQLELQAAFGLRDRVEPIRTTQQRGLLERAKALCVTRLSSTSDPNRKLHQWKNHYYEVVRACGISRRDGITSHGLWHEYANTRYRELAGSDSPVRGGGPVARDADPSARHIVAEELGHSRECVTTHYLGR